MGGEGADAVVVKAPGVLAGEGHGRMPARALAAITSAATISATQPRRRHGPALALHAIECLRSIGPCGVSSVIRPAFLSGKVRRHAYPKRAYPKRARLMP